MILVIIILVGMFLIGIPGMCIYLAVCNQKYEREIRNIKTKILLFGEKQQISERVVHNVLDARVTAEMLKQDADEKNFVEKNIAKVEERKQTPEPEVHILKESEKHIKKGGFGKETIALVLGVLFVIIAGFIFATTTWSILSNSIKVFLVIAITGLFFGTSVFADKKLRLPKTSAAFYSLGVVFLFVSVLTVGYFGYFGNEVRPGGENAFTLYAIGMFVTEIGLVLGLKKYSFSVYAHSVLFGFTVFILFLFQAFHPERDQLSVLLGIYAVIILISERFAVRLLATSFQRIANVYKVFAIVNITAISLFILFGSGTGLSSGAATTIIAGILLWKAMSKTQTGIEGYGFALFLTAGIFRSINYNSIPDYSFLLAGLSILFAVMESLGLLGAKQKKTFIIISMVLSVLSSGIYLLPFVRIYLGDFKVPASTVIGFGLLLITTSYLSIKKKQLRYSVLYSVIVVLFSYSTAFYLKLDNIWIRLIIAAVIMEIAFYIGCFAKKELRNVVGDILYVCNIAALLRVCCMKYASDKMGAWLLIGAILLFAGVVILVKKEHWGFRHFVIILISMIAIPVYELLQHANLDISYYTVLLIYFAGFTGLDFIRKKEYRISIAVYGLFIPLCFEIGDDAHLVLFPLIVAAYLIGQYNKIEIVETKRNYVNYAGVNLLYGSYLLADYYVQKFDYALLAPAGVLVILFLVPIVLQKRIKNNYFVIIGSTILSVLMTGCLIFHHKLGTWYLIIYITWVVLSYLISYIKDGLQVHIVTAIMSLSVPALIFTNKNYILDNGLSQEQKVIVTFVLLGILLVSRLCRPIIGHTDNGNKRIDWFHIILPAHILLYVMGGSKLWNFTGFVLLLPYTMQYYFVEGIGKRFQKAVLTMMGVLGCISYWMQPFFEVPEWCWLEFYMLPAALLIFLLSYIWGKESTVIKVFQRAGYLLCLLVLAIQALTSTEVSHTIIYGVLALVIFIGSFIKQSVFWMKTSSVIMVGLLLYQTRDFWTSLSWWVYLMIAGIALIAVASYYELKKRK
ncbi:hypothetical protein [Anaeromicropila populeti]|uniref:Uncharacterized protein n=1 Tax=Anaeromicropila populeti TaxID=37658 RepID=A0A1I6IWE1_9FIRM|nr:hypothetical protein [Anaeromicropila populeti]SFR71055.1 hypothetical protein SAMN05661086_01184 [Anaeromicropila populeti]